MTKTMPKPATEDFPVVWEHPDDREALVGGRGGRPVPGAPGTG